MNVTKTKSNNKIYSLTFSGRRQMIQCPKCGDVNYKGIWYAPDSRFVHLLDPEQDIVFDYTCPACVMEENGDYEGVLYVKDIPKNLYDQVISAIFSEAVQDYIANPQHRLLDFCDILDGYKVTATSSAMVRRIGQKIQSMFGTCEIQSTLNGEEGPLQIIKVRFISSEYF